jgi:predicted dehydrogenase
MAQTQWRALVVGAGGIAGAWLPPLKAEKISVVAVVDLDLQRARNRIKEFGLQAEASRSLPTALKVHQPDFVVDLTVPEAHCHVTCTALRHGCHVIGEKPMASSMTEARRMVRAADKAGTLYMVSQSRRYDAIHETARRALAKGTIGALTTINCDFYLGAHFGGFRDAMDSPLILDMAIHHFDMARFLTGADPVRVWAHEFNPRGSWYKGDVAANCVFEMSNGIVFSYRGSWCAEGCHTSWNGDWRIIGEQGTLIMAQDQPPRGEIVKPAKTFNLPRACVEPRMAKLKAGGQHGALRELLVFLRNGTLPQGECHDNIKSLAMVFAAIESAKKGRWVAVRGET